MDADAALDALRRDAAECTRCDLYKDATQTVFGEGPASADVMLVGEQPGDKEDLAGEPFVGPAGRLLDEALAAAGIDRDRVYVTNAVKHFKWEPRGKRRIHKTPNRSEVLACSYWFDRELAVVQPRIVVALGGTAAKSLLGPKFKVTESRGQFVEWDRDPMILATVHPSSILRSPDDGSRASAKDAFIADLEIVSSALAGSRSLSGRRVATPSRPTRPGRRRAGP
jgi:DNA polymerase